MGAEQGADLVAGEHPPSGGRIIHGRGATVGIRVVGDDQIGVRVPGEGHSQVDGPGFLRVGEGDRRKVRIGLCLFGNEPDIGESGSGEGPRHRVAPDTVHRGQDDAQGRTARPFGLIGWDQGSDRLKIAGLDISRFAGCGQDGPPGLCEFDAR